jgi:hypothetical protein
MSVASFHKALLFLFFSFLFFFFSFAGDTSCMHRRCVCKIIQHLNDFLSKVGETLLVGSSWVVACIYRQSWMPGLPRYQLRFNSYFF